jgi:hypothetical protein
VLFFCAALAAYLITRAVKYRNASVNSDWMSSAPSYSVLAFGVKHSLNLALQRSRWRISSDGLTQTITPDVNASNLAGNRGAEGPTQFQSIDSLITILKYESIIQSLCLT